MFATYINIYEWTEKYAEQQKDSGLFLVFNSNFRSCHNRIVLLMKYETEVKRPWIHPGINGQVSDKGSGMWL